MTQVCLIQSYVLQPSKRRCDDVSDNASTDSYELRESYRGLFKASEIIIIIFTYTMLY